MSRQADVIEELRVLGISSDEVPAPSNGVGIQTPEEAIAEHRLAINEIGNVANLLSEAVQAVRGQMRDIDNKLRALDIKLAAYGGGRSGDSLS